MRRTSTALHTWIAKRSLLAPEDGACASAFGPALRALQPKIKWRFERPTLQCESSSTTSASLKKAALAFVRAAPRLLPHAPASHPIGVAICTIVRVGGTGRFGRLSADVVVIAAPGLLRSLPLEIRATHRAIVGIYRTDGRGRRRGTDVVVVDCQSRRRHGRRRGRRRWRRGGWLRCGASHANAGTAIIFLFLRPIVGVISWCCTAIIDLGRTSQQPKQQGDQQQQAQARPRDDDASEVPSAGEVAPIAHVLVGRLLHIVSLARAHVGQVPCACTATSDTTSSALLALCNAASVACGAASDCKAPAACTRDHPTSVGGAAVACLVHRSCARP